MSNFEFLKNDFPEIHGAATRAEGYLKSDTRSASFYARRGLELSVAWLYDNDGLYRRPYNDSLANLLTQPAFRSNVPQGVQLKADAIRKLGNAAVHSNRRVSDQDAFSCVWELFHVTYWLARTYGRTLPGDLPQTFEPALVPDPEREAKSSVKELQRLEAELHKRDEAARMLEAQITEYRAQDEARRADIAARQAEVAARKTRNQAQTDTHNYNEAQTRALIIDLLLREAGWDPQGENVAEFRVDGLPDTKTGRGRVDYVLWGDDGLPLAVVEAKRTTVDERKGRQQAKGYADALEKRYGRRPLIFYTNGYDTHFWDDTFYPPRQVQGFFTRDELERTIQRREGAKPLAEVETNKDIINRYYQEEAIRRIAERLESRYRTALLVMATGTGKTRTAIALVDVLMRAGWAKRVLFLADRRALVKQAVNAFKRHLPASSPVNLLLEKEAESSRVVVSTYQTMMAQIDGRTPEGERQFSPGHFDLIIVDEAHRSIYQKYAMIFRYFDGLLVGLTATPKDDVDRNTYELFDLQSGLPTYAYELDQAVADDYLVPPNPLDMPTKFLERGIKYGDLSPEEQEAWDELEWRGDGEVPAEIRSADLNKWLFNQDTVDKVLKHLMEHGVKVAGGDRLGKTILFAANHNHAMFVAERFDTNYPHLAGHFARVIDNQEPKAEGLLEAFAKKEGSKDGEPVPHIAVSVDMLDTGVDIPEVVNLVFFKMVRSKTKFFQMLGRGTRLSEDLFAPGEHKAHFNVFDCCRNFEFFNLNPAGVKQRVQEPLSQQLFKRRLELLEYLSNAPDKSEDKFESGGALEVTLLDTLHASVAAMPLENFIVRAARQYVDPFVKRERWNALSSADRANLARHVSGLPTTLEDEDEKAKRFDLLVLNLQLTSAQDAPASARHKNRVIDVAEGLNQPGKQTIPQVKLKLPLIQAVLSEEWWQAAGLERFEEVRLGLRGLVQYLETSKRNPVYSNFEDELGEAREIEVSYLAGGVNIAQYKKRVERYLMQMRNEPPIKKIRKGEPLSSGDVEQLEHLFFESDTVESREAFEAAYGKEEGLARFIRKLVGLDRRAAKEAFGRYLDSKTFTADQIQFVNHIIDHLTKNGFIDPGILYERPYTDLHEEGLEGVFPDEQANALVDIIQELNGATGIAVQ